MLLRRTFLCAAAALSAAIPLSAAEPSAPAGAVPAKKTIALVAGRPSHGYGQHEHHAGCLLLAEEIRLQSPHLEAKVFRNGFPKDLGELSDAATIVMFSDGGGGHMAIPRQDEIDKLMKKGVGAVCIHYAVEVPKGKSGDYFLDWIGGYFEAHWSVNPHWKAEFKEFPKHPITRGVKPFAIQDEWYYHMRFRENMEGVTPILTAVPPESTLSRPDGPHSGNPHVRKTAGQPQHVGWAYDRPDGGRGFGFTGGHFHWNWGNDDFRKVVVNAILWTAHEEVPEDGAKSRAVTQEKLEENQDEPKPQPKK